MARSTRLVILIKNIYTTQLVILIKNIYIYFMGSSSIPFYSTSNGITRKNAIVEYLDKSYVPFKSNSNREERYSRVPRLRYDTDTQLKGPKGNAHKSPTNFKKS